MYKHETFEENGLDIPSIVSQTEEKSAARVFLYRLICDFNFDLPQIELLLGKRPSWSKQAANEWQLLGGKMNGYEPPLDTMIRELFEEIQFDVKQAPQLIEQLRKYIRSWGIHDYEATGWTTHSFMLQVDELFDPPIIKLNDHQEMPEVAWFSRRSLELIAVAFNHRQIIENIFELLEAELRRKLQP